MTHEQREKATNYISRYVAGALENDMGGRAHTHTNNTFIYTKYNENMRRKGTNPTLAQIYILEDMYIYIYRTGRERERESYKNGCAVVGYLKKTGMECGEKSCDFILYTCIYI